MTNIDRPPRDWVLMQSATAWQTRSTCSRAAVGAVISREGRILASGYNGSPSGMEHCNHKCTCPNGSWTSEAWPGLEMHVLQCPTQVPCTQAIHAEANSIIHAAKYGVGVKGADLHTTMSPCINCAGMIINAGIKRVVYLDAYRDESGLNLLTQAGLRVVQYKYGGDE